MTVLKNKCVVDGCGSFDVRVRGNYVGYFTDKDQAKFAYDQKAKEVHGEFANHG